MPPRSAALGSHHSRTVAYLRVYLTRLLKTRLAGLLRAGLAALLILSAASACRAEATEDAENIIRRHIEALGGEETLLSTHSFMTISRIEFSGTGLQGTMRSWFVKPCLSCTEISMGFFKIRQGYDGERMWMIDQNGKLQLRHDPASVQNQLTTCLLENDTYLFEREGLSLSVAGADTIEGIACEVIELIPEGGNKCMIYISSDDYLAVKIVIDSPEGQIAQIFSDYRPVSGRMFPFSTETRHLSSGRSILSETDSIAVNVPVDPVIFLPPAMDIRDFTFTGGCPAVVPFEFLQGHIYLPVKIGDDGADVIFLLDSGAGMTVIDSILAVEMDFPFGGRIPGAGAVGMTEFQLARIPGLAVRGVEFSAQTVIAFPLSEMASFFLERKIGGILGYDFLSRFITRIDYENLTLSFFDPDSFAPAPGSVAVEAPLINNIFSIEARLEETYQGTFLLDTGANSSMLQRGFVERHGLLNGRESVSVAILGAGGTEKASLARFESFELGGFLLEGPVFALPSGNKGIGAFEKLDGIVGNNILERFIVTLDYENQRCYLEKGGRFDNPFHPDRSGIALTRTDEGGVRIYAVAPGSPAFKAGLEAGDEVVSVDGRAVESFLNIEEIMQLFSGADGSKINLEIIRDNKNKNIIIKLERYI